MPVTQSPDATSAPVQQHVPTHQITQHLLAADGPSKVQLPQGSRLLDVHIIDGRYYVRAVEPVEAKTDDAEIIEIVPAALGTKLSLRGLMPLVVRAGGIHFFATNYEV